MIKNKLKEIKTRYKVQYGAVIFDVKIKNTDTGYILEGIVLAGRQKKEAYLAAQEILKDSKIRNNIKILGEPEEEMEIGWGIVNCGIADIWGIFSDGKKVNETVRATQALKGDFVRILAKKRNYYLVQCQDLAIGWAVKRQIANSKWQTAKQKWKKAAKVEKGELFKAKLTIKTRKKFIGFLENYLYVPYVWGGTTELGIDCSGLVQKFYWEIFGILLPRNSRDQAEFGKEINLKKSQFGDLVFLREKNKKYPHIGIIIEPPSFYIKTGKNNKNLENILILNARREKGGVVIESAEEILKGYNLISVKRLMKLK